MPGIPALWGLGMRDGWGSSELGIPVVVSGFDNLRLFTQRGKVAGLSAIGIGRRV